MLKILIKNFIRILDARCEYLLLKLTPEQSRELAKGAQDFSEGGKIYFTPNESALLETLAFLIVPSDEENPGARDADVVNSLERAIANLPERRKVYLLCLHSLNEWSQWKFKKPFTKLDQEHQITLLKMIDPKAKGSKESSSLKSKINRKFRVLRYMRAGLYPAMEFFPLIVDDVLQAFYTSEVSWLWLDYDGPPMPDGYPALSKRQVRAEGPKTTGKVPSPDQIAKSLRILVCMKQVPNKESHFVINHSGYGINEDDLAYETNESDMYALEEALQLKSKISSEVVVLSLGEKRVQKILKDGLARGADRAIHLNMSGSFNSNANLTAKAIAAIVRKEDIDLILTGVESSDLAYGQTGIILAQLLGWPHASIVVALEINAEQRIIRVMRELENNSFEWLEVPLPAVLTVQTGINTPRTTTLKGIIQARNKLIQVLIQQKRWDFPQSNKAGKGLKLTI